MRLWIIIALLLVTVPALAETIDLNITDWDLPDAKPGFICSVRKIQDDDNPFQATLASTVIEQTSKYATINVDLGGAPAINEPIIGLTIKLSDYFKEWGVNFPMRKWFDIRPGGYLGFLTNDYLDDDEHDNLLDYVDYGGYLQIMRYTF